MMTSFRQAETLRVESGSWHWKALGFIPGNKGYESGPDLEKAKGKPQVQEEQEGKEYKQRPEKGKDQDPNQGPGQGSQDGCSVKLRLKGRRVKARKTCFSCTSTLTSCSSSIKLISPASTLSHSLDDL